MGCEEGACGACTVAIARWNKREQRARYISSDPLNETRQVIGVSRIITPFLYYHNRYPVTVSHLCQRCDMPRFVSTNACITPLYLVDGALVLTVEGIGEHLLSTVSSFRQLACHSDVLRAHVCSRVLTIFFRHETCRTQQCEGHHSIDLQAPRSVSIPSRSGSRRATRRSADSARRASWPPTRCSGTATVIGKYIADYTSTNTSRSSVVRL